VSRGTLQATAPKRSVHPNQSPCTPLTPAPPGAPGRSPSVKFFSLVPLASPGKGKAVLEARRTEAPVPNAPARHQGRAGPSRPAVRCPQSKPLRQLGPSTGRRGSTTAATPVPLWDEAPGRLARRQGGFSPQSQPGRRHSDKRLPKARSGARGSHAASSGAPAGPRAGLRRRDSPSRSPSCPRAVSSLATSLPRRTPWRGGSGRRPRCRPLRAGLPSRRSPHLLGPPPPPTGGRAPSSSTRRCRAGPCCRSPTPPLAPGGGGTLRSSLAQGRSRCCPRPLRRPPRPRRPVFGVALPGLPPPAPGMCSGEADSGGRSSHRASRPRGRGRGPEAAAGPRAAGCPAVPAASR